MRDQVEKVIEDQFGKEYVPGKTLEQLGADSLDVVEIGLTLENRTGIFVSDDELEKMRAMNGHQIACRLEELAREQKAKE